MDEATAPAFDPIRHRRGGRPRKPPQDKHDEFITFRVTPEQRAQGEEKAARAGLSLSAYSRAAFLGDTVRIVVRKGAPPEVILQLRYMGNNVKQVLHEARLGNFPPHVEAKAAEALDIINAELRALLHGPEC
jgi:hypothetical protein